MGVSHCLLLKSLLTCVSIRPRQGQAADQTPTALLIAALGAWKLPPTCPLEALGLVQKKAQESQPEHTDVSRINHCPSRS